VKKCFILFFLILTSWFLILPRPVSAKDYSITSVDFKFQLNEDGSADVVEQRTYYFDGSYSWIDQWIPLKIKNQKSKIKNDKSYKISNFELWEKGKKYLQNNTMAKNTYELTITPEKLYLKAYYSANYESKTFTLKYKIDNAVTNHKDIAEFYWQ